MNRPNRYAIMTVWADAKAFEAHGKAAHTAQFRETFGPMTGALYDERLYRALE